MLNVSDVRIKVGGKCSSRYFYADSPMRCDVLALLPSKLAEPGVQSLGNGDVCGFGGRGENW